MHQIAAALDEKRHFGNLAESNPAEPPKSYSGLGESATDWGRRSATVERMTIQRMEHVGIVVDDLAAATTFFVELLGAVERYQDSYRRLVPSIAIALKT